MMPTISNRLAALLITVEERGNEGKGEWLNRIRKEYTVPFWITFPHQTRRTQKDVRKLYILPLIRGNELLVYHPFWSFLEHYQGKENLVIALKLFCPDLDTTKHYLCSSQFQGYRVLFDHFYWCKYRGVKLP